MPSVWILFGVPVVPHLGCLPRFPPLGDHYIHITLVPHPPWVPILSDVGCTWFRPRCPTHMVPLLVGLDLPHFLPHPFPVWTLFVVHAFNYCYLGATHTPHITLHTLWELVVLWVVRAAPGARMGWTFTGSFASLYAFPRRAPPLPPALFRFVHCPHLL